MKIYWSLLLRLLLIFFFELSLMFLEGYIFYGFVISNAILVTFLYFQYIYEKEATL